MASGVVECFRVTEDDGETVYHNGAVGINTGSLDSQHALTVQGNIKVQGKVLTEHPPPANKPVKPLDPALSLTNIKKLNFDIFHSEQLNNFHTWTQSVRIDNLSEVIPEAVVTSSSPCPSYVDSADSSIKVDPTPNRSVSIDMERLLYESLNAVKVSEFYF